MIQIIEKITSNKLVKIKAEYKFCGINCAFLAIVATAINKVSGIDKQSPKSKLPKYPKDLIKIIDERTFISVIAKNNKAAYSNTCSLKTDLKSKVEPT